MFNTYSDALAHCEQGEVPARHGRYWIVVEPEDEDGYAEQRSAYKERLRADISPEELSEQRSAFMERLQADISPEEWLED